MNHNHSTRARPTSLHHRVKQAICCPDCCCSPADCYAEGHRDVPVRVDKAAKAVAALLCAEWRANMARA